MRNSTPKRGRISVGMAALILAGCGMSVGIMAERFQPAINPGPTPIEALHQVTAAEVAKASQSGTLIPLLRRRFPAIPQSVWMTQVAAVPFDRPKSLPIIVVTELKGSNSRQQFLTYTRHGVVSQPTSSILSNPLASENPGLVLGNVSGRPAFLVTSEPMYNQVNLIWWRNNAWHRIWSQVVTTSEVVSLHSVQRFVAGNTPGITFVLVAGPHPYYRPVPSRSTEPYWVIDPKVATLGKPLTIVGCIPAMAGKTLILNWSAPNALVQWQVPIAKNGEFSVRETIPSRIDGQPAPTGSYTLNTVLNRWGDSTELLQGYVSVSRSQ